MSPNWKEINYKFSTVINLTVAYTFKYFALIAVNNLL